MKLPLIFFTVILLLIILIKWYKNRPVKESAPAKTDTSKKKKTFPFGTIIILVILVAIGWFGYRYFTGLPSRQQAPAVAQQQWQLPICAGGEYDFSTAEIPGEISVGFQAGCISQVTLPPRVVFRTDPSADVKIKFIDGSEYIDGPKKQVWYGLKKGVFKVRGLSEAGTMKITLEKSS